MKKLLFISIVPFILFSACKKDNPNKPATTFSGVKTDILGTWYYLTESIGYYENGTQDVYNDPEAIDLNQRVHFKFNSDGSAIAVSPDGTQTTPFSYQVTSTNGTDSLIFSGAYTDRYKIISVSKSQLQLSNSVAEGKFFYDAEGNVAAYTDLDVATTTLAHSYY